MTRLLTMLTMGVVLSTCTTNTPAFAQQSPTVPSPSQGEGPNCLAIPSLKSDAIVTKILQDNDGDWWATVRFASTGRVLIGYVSRATGKFCVSGEGRTQPEA